MVEKKLCRDCKFFVGEMFRAIGPGTGYCDNEKSPFYRKDTHGDSEVCDDFEENKE